MQIITDPAEMQAIAEKLRLNRQLIGVVMTMGALHEGHLSLVKLAARHAGTIIMTIFVNPTQFGPSEDFQRYPRPFEQDISHAGAAGVDYLFAPPPEAIYPEGFQTSIHCGALGERIEGAARPGHFNGVATIVTKLLQITRAHIAVFGQKDAQQLAVIRRVTRDLNLGVTILGAPIVRETDGLAVSSRNIYLPAGDRTRAGVLFKALEAAGEQIGAGRKDLQAIAREAAAMIESAEGFSLDYALFVDEETFEEAVEGLPGREYRLLLAVRTPEVRLIDNALFRC